jgi:hypothetical protein
VGFAARRSLFAYEKAGVFEGGEAFTELMVTKPGSMNTT